MVKVESNQPDLFGPSSSRDWGNTQPTYLQTEIETIRSNPVLDLALSGATPPIANHPMIKNSTDPKTELLKRLDLQIIPNTHWIRVAIESTVPEEARDIVNAVIDAYSATTAGEGEGTTTTNKMIVKRDLTKVIVRDFEEYRKRLENDIKASRGKLLELAKRGSVEFQKPNLFAKTDENEQAPQPSFNSQSLEQYRTIKDHLMQTEFALMDLEARYTAKQAEVQQAQAGGDSPVLSNNEQLRDQIAQEFKRDPEVASLIDQIKVDDRGAGTHQGSGAKGCRSSPGCGPEAADQTERGLQRPLEDQERTDPPAIARSHECSGRT